MLEQGLVMEAVRAVLAVLAHARYGDVLFALEQRADSGTTYTAEVPGTHATRLTALAEPAGITRLANGRIRLTAPALAYLRGLPERLGCRVDDENRLRLAGEPYRLIREPGPAHRRGMP